MSSRIMPLSPQILALSLLVGMGLPACSPVSQTLNNPIGNSTSVPLSVAEISKQKTEFDQQVKTFLSQPQSSDFNFGPSLAPTSLIQKQVETAQKVAELRKNSQRFTLKGQVQLPELGEPTLLSPVPDQNIVLYSPDGLTLAVTQSDRFGNYQLDEVPAGMRVELVAHSAEGQAVARAVLDLPTEAKEPILTQDLTPRSSVIAETLWFALKGGNSSLENVSVKQIESFLNKNPAGLREIENLQYLTQLTQSLNQELETMATIAPGSSFQTQSVFRRKTSCVLRAWQSANRPFRIAQTNLVNENMTISNNYKILSNSIEKSLIQTLNNASPNLTNIIKTLPSNSILLNPIDFKDPLKSLNSIFDLNQELSKLSQVSVAQNSLLLTNSIGKELKPDLIGNLGWINSPQCGQFAQINTPQNATPLASPTPAPVLQISLNLTKAPPGTQIEISGKDLPKNLATTLVNFGETKARIVGMSLKLDALGKENAVLKVIVPEFQSGTSVSVTLTTDGVKSNAVPFSIQTGLSQLSVNSAVYKDVVTAEGLFDNNSKLILTPVLLADRNSKADKQVLKIETRTPQSLSFVLPDVPAGDYKVSLESDSSIQKELKVYPASPEIIEFSPNPGIYGRKYELKIKGIKYDALKGFSFNGIDYLDMFYSNEYVKQNRDNEGFVIATDNLVGKYLVAGKNRIRAFYNLTLGGGTSKQTHTPAFEFMLAPFLSGFTQNGVGTGSGLISAKAGQTIELLGNFAEKKEDNIVKFGTTQAQIIALSVRNSDKRGSERYLSVKVPENIKGKNDISVTVAGMTSNSLDFTVLSANLLPEITQISDFKSKKTVNKMQIGQDLSLSTKNTYPGKIILKIGGFSSESDSNFENTNISFQVPNLAGKQIMTVTSDGQTSKALEIEISPPKISQPDLSILRLGQKVNFKAISDIHENVKDISLKINDKFGKCIYSVSEKLVNCEVPRDLKAGIFKGEIVLGRYNEPDARLYTLDEKFNFEIPYGFSKSTYPIKSNSSVSYFIFTGTGFDLSPGGNQLTIGGKKVDIFLTSLNTLEIKTLPSGFIGSVDVEVKTGTAKSQAKLLFPPRVDSVSHSSLKASDIEKSNLEFTLNGEGFNPSPEKNLITIRENYAPGFALGEEASITLTAVKASKTQITFKFPAKGNYRYFDQKSGNSTILSKAWSASKLDIEITPENYGTKVYTLNYKR